MKDEAYHELLKHYHKLSDRHILVIETYIHYFNIQKVVILSKKIRKAGNELFRFMRKNYDQLIRTKKYRKLLKFYDNTEGKAEHKILAE